jgi:hypothetical protein
MFLTSYAMRKTARNHRTKEWRHGAPERCGDQSDSGDCRTAKTTVEPPALPAGMTGRPALIE